jgi:hypothetical protein
VQPALSHFHDVCEPHHIDNKNERAYIEGSEASSVIQR